MQNTVAPPAPGEIKCVIIGDGAVGKTCLLIRHVSGNFDVGYQPTVFDNYALNVTCQGQPFLLKLFDTAGQEGFENLRRYTYPGTHVFLLCFAVDSRASFDNIEKWKNDVRAVVPNAPIILVGCQSDKRLRDSGNIATLSGQIILPNEGMKAASQIGASAYLECSAKTGDGITTVFNKAIELGCGLQLHGNKRCCTIV
uniref:Ras-related C3 botulinum toxin substrate 1 n=1 Tax=Schistocephalus solidus TaxID=70667 RepID=A0A0X3Q0S1_SCHSO